MDAGTKQELQRAYAYLKSGDRKSASQILVSVLKTHPDSEQGWLMLSLAVDDPQRQIYALQQVLRVNPDNEKARERLSKLGGAAPAAARPITPDKPATPAYQPEAEEDAPFASAGDEDLLTARLFGESAAPSAGALSSEPAAGGFDYAEDEEDDRPFEEEPTTVAPKAKPRRERKAGGGRRLLVPVLLLLGLAVLLGGGYWALSSGLLGAVASAPATELPTPTETEFALPPTWTPTVFMSPTPLPTATLAPPPSPTALGQQVPSAGLQAITTVESQVRAVRGLTATPELGRALVSPGTLEEVLRSETSRDTFARQANDESAVYSTLGLIFPGANLQTYYQNSQVLPFGGLYVPENDAIYLVGLSIDNRQEYYYAHLYTLALLNEEYGLGALGLSPECARGFDLCRALNALVQGDAMLTRAQWATRSLPAAQARELPALDVLPPLLSDLNTALFVEPDLNFPYVEGRAFVEALYAEGGWAAVNAAYANPPASTEHILHPDRYLAGDMPLVVVDPLLGEVLPPGWRLLKQDTLGEWGTQMMLAYNLNLEAGIDREAATIAADGWGGDEFQVYIQDGTRATALKAHWIFDTFEDALEFDAALALSLGGWFPGEPDADLNEICYGSGPIACTVFIDNEVFLFVLPDADLMDAVLDLYAFGG